MGGNDLGREASEEVEKQCAGRRGVQVEVGERGAGARWKEPGLANAGHAESLEDFEQGSVLM